MWKTIKREILDHKTIYFLLAGVLLIGTFIRVYRTDVILGFYYDQGRDAKVIWDFLHNARFFLIGPTTGIEGIFRGPWYYWLITPFYFFGKGDPVWPAGFLAFTSVIGIGFVYYIGAKAVDRTTGIIAAIIAAFSFHLVQASRWLSNPTPMLLLSVILVWAMVMVTFGKKWGWPIIAFVFGLSLFNFGSSGEVFYLPTILIFAIWQRRNLFNKKYLLVSLFLFALTVLPLVLFDLKHQGILRNNIFDFLITDKSFDTSTWRSATDKFQFYYSVYSRLIFDARYDKEVILLGIVLVAFIYYSSRLIKNSVVKILLLLFLSPSIGLIFFQGNFGSIYDYYLTGFFLVFVLLFSITLGYMWKNILGKAFVIYFLYLFLTNNADIIWPRLLSDCTGNNSICFVNQKQALDWVYQDANNRVFNVDVYVPPVIPHAYDYLFLWQGTKRCGENLCNMVDSQVPLLYTLYEVDPPHPERLEVWLARQKGIGAVEETQKFGGITVERRKRL